MRISDWSSDVCSSDLAEADGVDALDVDAQGLRRVRVLRGGADRLSEAGEADEGPQREAGGGGEADAHQAIIGDEQRSKAEGHLHQVGTAALHGADAHHRPGLDTDDMVTQYTDKSADGTRRG